MLYRYVMIGGALNGRTYQLPRDMGKEFRLPPSDKAVSEWMEARRKYDASSTGGWSSPAHAPTPPADTVYTALIVDVIEGPGDVNDPDSLIEVKTCVPEDWGTDPERVAREMIRYFTRMNNAAHDAVTNAGMITPEIVRLGKFVGIFHR